MDNKYIPNTPLKGLTARELFAKSDRRVIQEIVQEQVRLIDSKIQTAHGAGFSKIEHELPTNFSINNMNKQDAQIMIYSEVLMLYKNPEESGGKGFEQVNIDIGARSVLHISWLNGMDNDERELRRKFISGSIYPRARK